jgi:hypothetical protein
MSKRYTKKQFAPIIRSEWWKQLKYSTIETKSEILQGIMQYPAYTPLLQNEAKGIWEFIKTQIDKDLSNFNERCEINKNVSKLYWGNERYPNGIRTVSERYPNGNQMVSEGCQTVIKGYPITDTKTKTDTITDTGINTETKNNQDSIKLIVSEKEPSKINVPEYLLRSDSYDELTSEQIKIYDNPQMRELLNSFWTGRPVLPMIESLYSELTGTNIVKNSLNDDDFIDKFNNIARKYRITECKSIKGSRKIALQARLKEHNIDIDQFVETCDAALSQSAFLRGETSSWKANLDFFLRASSFIKVIEGQYNGSIMQDLSAKDKLKLINEQKNKQDLQELIEKSKRGEI